MFLLALSAHEKGRDIYFPQKKNVHMYMSNPLPPFSHNFSQQYASVTFTLPCGNQGQDPITLVSECSFALSSTRFTHSNHFVSCCTLQNRHIKATLRTILALPSFHLAVVTSYEHELQPAHSLSENAKFLHIYTTQLNTQSKDSFRVCVRVRACVCVEGGGGIQASCVSERQTCIFHRTSHKFHINAENVIK